MSASAGTSTICGAVHCTVHVQQLSTVFSFASCHAWVRASVAREAPTIGARRMRRRNGCAGQHASRQSPFTPVHAPCASQASTLLRKISRGPLVPLHLPHGPRRRDYKRRYKMASPLPQAPPASTSFSTGPAGPSQPPPPPRPADCLSCRIVGTGALGATGLYAINQARAHQPGSVIGKRIMAGVGVLFLLGSVARWRA